MTDNRLIEQVTPLPTVRRRCWGILDWLCKLFIILFRRPKRGDPCLYLPERIINRPDPCIYSQFLLMQLDQPVTWDNPDVELLREGVEQYSGDLAADTEYQVVITVHNSSREKPANGTQVAVRWIEFGAGAQIRHPIATLLANVPVWPAVAMVETTWRTPATPGHYCIEVELSHAEDGNPANYRGWNNTQVRAAASEVEIPVRIFNRWVAGCPPVFVGGRTIRTGRILVGWGGLGALVGVALATSTVVDLPAWPVGLWGLVGYLVSFFIGYAIEGLLVRGRKAKQRDPQEKDIPCNLVELTVDSYTYDDVKGKEADPDAMFAPRPPAWPARVEPSLFHFAPDEAYRDVVLIVDAPDAVRAPKTFNVNARQGGVPTGGVTISVTRGQEE